METSDRNLSSLIKGDSAKISKISEGVSSLRLMEMGLVPGIEVSISAISPFGDPIAVQAGDFNISLRKADANLVVLDTKY